MRRECDGAAFNVTMRELDLKMHEIAATGWQLLKACPLCGSAGFSPFFLGREHCVLCKCNDCGIVFLNPQPHEARYQPGWVHKRYVPSAIKRGYFSEHDLSPDFEKLYSSYRKIVDMAVSLGETHLLDIGCGIGLSMLAMQHKGLSPVGVEVDSEFVEFARSMGLEVREQDITRGPLDRRFDVATLNSVLEHVKAPVDFLSAIRTNVLAPGGALAITVPNFASLEFIRDGRRWQMITGGHLWYFTEETLTMVASRAGFSVEHTERDPRPPKGLETAHIYIRDVLGLDVNTKGGIGLILRAG